MALTGPEALKAEKKCNSLEEQVENIQNLVQQKMKEGGLKFKETSQEISRIGEVRIVYRKIVFVVTRESGCLSGKSLLNCTIMKIL